MKTWLKILIVAALLCVIPAMLFLASSLSGNVYDETYYAELSDLYARLKNAEGKRLILLGNSDVAFGTDGALLESMLSEHGFDYTVCPFGLYGAVGTSAMTDLCRSALREGDLVVFIVEPLDDVLTTYFGATAYWKCAERDGSLLLPLSGEKKSALVGNCVPYLQERYAFVLAGEKPQAEGAYRKDSFNDRCDMVFDRAGNTMRLGYDTAAPIDLMGLTIEEAFADEINALCQKAEAVGATVVVSFSPMNRSALTDESEESILSFFTTVNHTFRCPVISDPHDYILDSGWFYDSNVHLNSAGATLRTELLAADLLAYLGCRAAIAVEAPEMPGSIAAQSETVVGDADAFTFTPLSDGAGSLVAGLTERGLSAESLTVPSEYEGKPVVGFADGALDGAAGLVELTLPDSIELLGDGLFQDTGKLERLVFLHRSTLPQITAHTFDGASALRVFVPQEDYPLYRDGVGCAVNPWEDDLGRIVTY